MQVAATNAGQAPGPTGLSATQAQSKPKVAVGDTVKVSYEMGSTEVTKTFTLTGRRQPSDLAATPQVISVDCDWGRAILGKEVDEAFSVKVGTGTYAAQIISIEKSKKNA